MIALLQRYATPFITGLFLVSLVSGVALFFHWGQGWFHSMHEWLSMVLILPFVLHLWRNWRAFSNYFRRAPMAIALVICLVCSLYYVIPSSQQAGGRAGGPPQFAFSSVILNNPLSQVAPLIGSTSEELVQKLQSAGYTVASADTLLSDVASRSGKSEAELVQQLVPRRH